MKSSRYSLTKVAGFALLGLGCVIGAGAIGALVFDWTPSIPPWMIRIGMIKLALLASGGLLAAGALVGRRVTQARASASVDATSTPPQLGPDDFPDGPIDRVERVSVRDSSRDSDG